VPPVQTLTQPPLATFGTRQHIAATQRAIYHRFHALGHIDTSLLMRKHKSVSNLVTRPSVHRACCAEGPTLCAGVAARESMGTRLYHAMHAVDAHLGVRLFIVVVAFVAVRSVGQWRIHRSCNPVRGVSEPESRCDKGRRGAAGETAKRGRNCACGTRHANFGRPLAPSSRAHVRCPRARGSRRRHAATGQYRCNARGAQRGAIRPAPLSPCNLRRAQSWATERFPRPRAY